MAAAAERVEPEAVAAGLPYAARMERERREKEIGRLALARWSNDEIAARMKLHPNSVSRIIGRLRRQGTLVSLKAEAEAGTTAASGTGRNTQGE